MMQKLGHVMITADQWTYTNGQNRFISFRKESSLSKRYNPRIRNKIDEVITEHGELLHVLPLALLLEVS